MTSLKFHRADDSNRHPTWRGNGLVPLGCLDPESGKLVLSPQRTLATAGAFVREFYEHPDGPKVRCHAGVLMIWRGNRFVPVEDGALKKQIFPWLNDAKQYRVLRNGDAELIDFRANPATVNAAIETVRSSVYLSSLVTPPIWLSGRANQPPADEILSCPTKNVHIPTGEIFAPTPSLFSVNAVDFDHDPDAEAPEEWIRFLEQLFGDDLESCQLLQEFMGYCLTADSSQQKMLLIVGPRRSGKGTIGRVFRRLVGTQSVVGPTIGSLAGGFGLQPLIGKTLAIVSDARFSGEGTAVVTERLLCISGEDTITIDRKYLPAATMKLPTRFVFLTNELPRFNDASMALAGRFLVLRLTRSFYGMEDPSLTSKLQKELPGILNWAIAGWKRLRQRGHFVQPTGTQSIVDELDDLASPMSVFIREWCVVGPDRRADLDELFTAWKTFCEGEGWSGSGTKQSFGRALRAACPGIERRRTTGHLTFYDGIGLQPPNWSFEDES